MISCATPSGSRSASGPSHAVWNADTAFAVLETSRAPIGSVRSSRSRISRTTAICCRMPGLTVTATKRRPGCVASKHSVSASSGSRVSMSNTTLGTTSFARAMFTSRGYRAPSSMTRWRTAQSPPAFRCRLGSSHRSSGGLSRSRRDRSPPLLDDHRAGVPGRRDAVRLEYWRRDGTDRGSVVKVFRDASELAAYADLHVAAHLWVHEDHEPRAAVSRERIAYTGCMSTNLK